MVLSLDRRNIKHMCNYASHFVALPKGDLLFIIGPKDRDANLNLLESRY
jgi:hypothetical protein